MRQGITFLAKEVYFPVIQRQGSFSTLRTKEMRPLASAVAGYPVKADFLPYDLPIAFDLAAIPQSYVLGVYFKSCCIVFSNQEFSIHCLAILKAIGCQIPHINAYNVFWHTFFFFLYSRL
jgi:hypothetical protein